MSGQIKRMKVRQTVALPKIRREALDAWKQSKKPQKSLTTKQGPSSNNGEPGPVRESVSVLRDQDGDPRYLNIALDALAAERKVWGVDEPTSIKGDLGGSVTLQINEREVTADHGDDPSAGARSASGTETLPP